MPYVPERSELPTDGAEIFLRFLEPVTAEEVTAGREIAEHAREQFTGSVAGDTDRHELVVTHNFLVA